MKCQKIATNVLHSFRGWTLKMSSFVATTGSKPKRLKFQENKTEKSENHHIQSCIQVILEFQINE